MKKGLLFVAGALLVGSTLASCGGKKEETKPQETGLTTVKASYKAEYILDVTSEKPGELEFEREVSDDVTVEADFTPGNLYLYGKRVGTELVEVPKTTYEVLVYKDGDSYKFLNSQMGAAVTLDSEEAAKAKINEYLRKVSFRSGGWIDSTSFVYPEKTNEYEHHHFLLDSTTIPLEDMLEEPTITDTETGRVAKTDMSYVGYQTDAGTSELHNDPIAASVAVNMDKQNRVTSFIVDYKDAWMDMPIGTPAPVLTLKGDRDFAATYDVELTKLTTIAHEAVQGTMAIKPSYKGGTVKVYSSENGKLEPRTELKNGDKVEIDSWITVEPTPNEGGGIVSVLNNTNAVSEVEGKYVFLAVAGTNEIKVVFSGGEAEKATVLFDESTKPNDIFTSWKLVEFEFAGAVDEIIDVTGNQIELKGATWFGIAYPKVDGLKDGKTIDDFKFTVLTPDGETKNGFPIPDPDASVPFAYMCWQIKSAGDYTVKIEAKASEPVATKATIKTSATYEGFPDVKVVNAPANSFSPEAIQAGTALTLGTDFEAELNTQISVHVGDTFDHTTVTVTVGDAALIGNQAFGGWFSFNVTEAKEYVVTITLKGAEPAPTKATIKTSATYEGFPDVKVVNAPANSFSPEAIQAGTALTLGTDFEAELNTQISVHVGDTFDHTTVTVTVGDAALIGNQAFGGWFSFNVTEAKEYVVTIVAK